MGRQPRPPDLRVTSTGLPLQVCELRAGGLRMVHRSQLAVHKLPVDCEP